MKVNFKNPKAVIWSKVNGDVTAGMLTSNLDFVPLNARPTTPVPAIRGYKRLWCLNRQRWVSLYSSSIITAI